MNLKDVIKKLDQQNEIISKELDDLEKQNAITNKSLDTIAKSLTLGERRNKLNATDKREAAKKAKAKSRTGTKGPSGFRKDFMTGTGLPAAQKATGQFLTGAGLPAIGSVLSTAGLGALLGRASGMLFATAVTGFFGKKMFDPWLEEWWPQNFDPVLFENEFGAQIDLTDVISASAGIGAWFFGPSMVKGIKNYFSKDSIDTKDGKKLNKSSFSNKFIKRAGITAVMLTAANYASGWLEEGTTKNVVEGVLNDPVFNTSAMLFGTGGMVGKVAGVIGMTISIVDNYIKVANEKIAAEQGKILKIHLNALEKGIASGDKGIIQSRLGFIQDIYNDLPGAVKRENKTIHDLMDKKDKILEQSGLKDDPEYSDIFTREAGRDVIEQAYRTGQNVSPLASPLMPSVVTEEQTGRISDKFSYDKMPAYNQFKDNLVDRANSGALGTTVTLESQRDILEKIIGNSPIITQLAPEEQKAALDAEFDKLVGPLTPLIEQNKMNARVSANVKSSELAKQQEKAFMEEYARQRYIAGGFVGTGVDFSGAPLPLSELIKIDRVNRNAPNTPVKPFENPLPKIKENIQSNDGFMEKIINDAMGFSSISSTPAKPFENPLPKIKENIQSNDGFMEKMIKDTLGFFGWQESSLSTSPTTSDLAIAQAMVEQGANGAGNIVNTVVANSNNTTHVEEKHFASIPISATNNSNRFSTVA